MAAGRDMNARLIIRLQDRFSAGLGALQRRLEGIMGAMRRISGVGILAGGVALAGPIAQAAQFEDVLRQSAITAGRTGTAVEEMVNRQRIAFERLARQTGQSSLSIAQANADMLAGGLDAGITERFLPMVARAATGFGATMQDMGSLVRQLNQQLGITEEQMPQAIAALAQAGREGNFELRDMARELGGILPIMRVLGMTGPQAVSQMGAAFQMAMRGANSASEAANNMVNALQKLAAPETVRNFAEVGVNLERVMQSAARQGISPLEALVQKLRELTGGNLNRLSELFGDRQALMGLLPLITETQRYIDTRDAAARAQPQLIDQAFQDRMRGATMQMALLLESTTQLWRRLSLVAAEGLAPMLDLLNRFHNWIDRIDTTYPGLIDKVLRWGLVLGGAATALATIVTVGGFVLKALAPLAAIMTGPIGWALLFLAGAAYLIWDNWEPIAAFFEGLWGRITSVFQAGWELIRPIIDAVVEGARLITNLLPEGAQAGAAFQPGAQAQRRLNFGQRGAASGFYPPEAAGPPSEARVGGEIIVRAAPGTEVVDTRTRNPGVPIVAPNRGPVVAVP
jgi:TP901 family phage tail tape measure protein